MYSLRALHVASTGAPGPHVYFQERWDEWLPFAFYVWVAQGDGRTIVVDSGFPKGPPLERLQDNVRKLGRRSEYRDIRHVDEALASVNIDPADVTDVFATNFVIHSTGGLSLLPNARIYFSDRGWRDYWQPEWPHPFARDVFFTAESLAWLTGPAWERVTLLGAEAAPLPGVRTFWTGCHRRSSTAVSFDTAVGKTVVFEPAFHFGNIERNVPIGGPESLADWYSAHARARQEIADGGLLLPQHDPELLVRYPGGIIAG
jgi:glyoxylase-like metal-dependent hydrolase (beta-lactamase superfamily II)